MMEDAPRYYIRKVDKNFTPPGHLNLRPRKLKLNHPYCFLTILSIISPTRAKRESCISTLLYP